MPQIVMAVQDAGNRVDGSVRGKAYAFLEKLSANDALPGLHIEPIQNSTDSRVRTGRVSQFWRAVLFKVQGSGTEAHYVYLGVWPHDNAIDVAKKVRLTFNPVTGITQVTAESPADRVGAGDEHGTAIGDATTATPLVALGLSLEDLVEELGFESDIAVGALEASDEDALLELAAGLVPWQGSALIALASGESVAEVKASLAIEEMRTDDGPDEDTNLIAGLKHPAAAMQFTFVEEDEELRRIIEEGDFAAWKVFLHPEQRRYVEQTSSGPFRLSGGAGTGKTVVLLHRARRLHRADPSARIVLTTFTKTLAEGMKRELRSLDPTVVLADKLGDAGVLVVGIDAAVSAAIRTNSAHMSAAVSAVLGDRSERIAARLVDSDERWRDAVASSDADLPADLRHAAFFQAEYDMVVVPGRITSRDGYFKARRPGRGVALDRVRRAEVWKVVESYRARSSIDGGIDFGEAAAVAAEALGRRSSPLVDHVLVDEGQDLRPTHWQFLRALVPEGQDDLFIAEDAHQRIYGQRVVLGRLGIKIVGRSRRLQLNYRTTAQNLHFAVQVLETGGYSDLESDAAEVSGYRSARLGPAPQLIRADNLTQELDACADLVRAWVTAGAAPDSIGILVRDATQAQQVSRGLDERGTKVRVVTNQAQTAKDPVVMTMHRAKGMEFSRVVIFGADSSLMPAQYVLKGLTDQERDDAVLRERSLFYVAATRARDELVVLWTGDPSEFFERATS
ncbi:UvrD/REP helicase N-terminal domain-containing protein [Nocardioides scoriae]|uniref:DNA 3'-5' helicase n=1 Tax=Nocardioides scoriae TaxID=642780 RepID=A0A1H1V165_9ACTN|nr:3'-5' exonuclease [Nocardioides scoriae]SDS78350.1 UvrD/REP helicase N-terminal domain-containing protein [Nocardioides scoriae]